MWDCKTSKVSQSPRAALNTFGLFAAGSQASNEWPTSSALTNQPGRKHHATMRGTLRPVFLGLLAGIATVAYLFPYFYLPGTWWRAIPSTALILAVTVLVFRKQAIEFLGLHLMPRAALMTLVVFVVAAFASNEVIGAIVAAGPFRASAHRSLVSGVHQFFQVLNDEMILRAAVLTLVLRVLPYPKSMALGCALLFSAAHHVVYRLHGVHIEAAALLTLFSFGVLANLLFLRFGHIGYGWALHYGWNLMRFGSVYAVDGRYLSEGMSFNYLEGNRWVVVASTCAALAAFVGYTKRPPSSSIGRLVLGHAPQHHNTREQ